MGKQSRALVEAMRRVDVTVVGTKVTEVDVTVTVLVVLRAPPRGSSAG